MYDGRKRMGRKKGRINYKINWLEENEENDDCIFKPAILKQFNIVGKSRLQPQKPGRKPKG